MVESDLRSLKEGAPSSPQTPPRISILLPFYNAAATLPACLHSITRQIEPRWRCVAVDDGSDDAGPALVRAAAASDPRFTLLTRSHSGLVASLNAGLEACRGDVVARMDADDWMHRDRLGAQLAALDASPELAAVGSRVRFFPRRAIGAGTRRYEAWLNGLGDPVSVSRDAFVECPIAHPSLMIRTEILQEFGYRDMGWPEDYDLVLRLLGSGHRLAVHPRRLLAWREGPGRLSRQGAQYSLERFTACKAAHLAAGPLRWGDHYLLWGYGSTGRALRRALLEHGKAPSHIIEVHPRRLGQTIQGAPVVGPEAIPSLPGWPILVSVSGVGPRSEIRESLRGMGIREGERFFCAA